MTDTIRTASAEAGEGALATADLAPRPLADGPHILAVTSVGDGQVVISMGPMLYYTLGGDVTMPGGTTPPVYTFWALVSLPVTPLVCRLLGFDLRTTSTAMGAALAMMIFSAVRDALTPPADAFPDLPTGWVMDHLEQDVARSAWRCTIRSGTGIHRRFGQGASAAAAACDAIAKVPG